MKNTPVDRINHGIFMRRDKISEHTCLGWYHVNKCAMFFQLWQLSSNICKKDLTNSQWSLGGKNPLIDWWKRSQCDLHVLIIKVELLKWNHTSHEGSKH